MGHITAHLTKPLAIATCLAACAIATVRPAGARSVAPTTLAGRLVLTGRDVGRGFGQQQQSFTPNQLAQQGTWTLAQLRAWGYLGGFERVFDRDLDTTNGEQIASSAGVYRTAAGAQQSLIADGNECTVGSWQLLASPTHLGNDSVFCNRTGFEHGYEGQLFFLVWRIGHFKGSISLSGVINHVRAAQAVALARHQAVKM